MRACEALAVLAVPTAVHCSFVRSTCALVQPCACVVRLLRPGDRRGVFGLAKQPNTFDPLALNANHLKAMAIVGADRSKGKASTGAAATVDTRAHTHTWQSALLPR